MRLAERAMNTDSCYPEAMSYRNSPSISRRAALILPSLCLAGKVAAAHYEEASDWPKWAPTRQRLYADFQQRARNEGKSLLDFGARCDGQADDSVAFQRAIAAGVQVLVLPVLPKGRTILMARQVVINRGITIIGAGQSSTIQWQGTEDSPFTVRPKDEDENDFVKHIHFDQLHVVRPVARAMASAILRGYNVRNISLTRCSTYRIGGLIVRHMRELKNLYTRGSGSATIDPAVVAGFAPNHVNDLNEDIFVFDNQIDGGAYMSRVVRFNFARRVAVVGNRGKFANISWWGGGARRSEGGAMQFLRRVRDVYITKNKLSGANGGVYGNNGDGILVAYNDVRSTTDVGIDFEGCFNVLAHNNIVRNAGNFCYATFYAAKNVIFRDNFGLQDGGGTNLHLIYGKGRYGPMKGRALLSLRSAGFGNIPGAIDVSFINNHFVWRGKEGLGNCVSSYFNSLRLEGNRFENVECDLTYIRTGNVELIKNRLSFDRAGSEPVRILGSSATKTRMIDNEIRVTAPQKHGSLAIFDEALSRHHISEIRGNRLIAPEALADLPAIFEMSRSEAGSYIVADNQLPAIYASAPARVRAKNNRNLEGRGIDVKTIPAGLLHSEDREK